MKLVSTIKSLLQNKEEVNHHFIFIEAPSKLVAPEIILWGEASWWPKKSSMRFVKKTEGDVRVGSRFEQQVRLPRGPKWDVEVTKLVPGEEAQIERTFLNGIFIGKESVALESRFNGTRVDYHMRCKIRGFINSLVWKFFFKGLHDKNIDMILTALKDYVLHKQRKSHIQ